MGIKGLMSLIKTNAPNSFKIIKKSSSKDPSKHPYYGKCIAIDASILLYQFMSAVRITGGELLRDSEGNITSHIQGFLTRTTNLLEQGIIPVYVFDGKPPDLKKDTLDNRKELKKKAQKELENAKNLLKELSDSDSEEVSFLKDRIEKETKRIISVTKEQNMDVKILLGLMGIICIDAPQEAEAQCVELVRAGICYAVASEDMDSLTFGSNRIIRGLTASIKDPIIEINLNKVMAEFGISNHDMFIDLCILCGCDYCPGIKGIGPKTALSYIIKFKTIEEILKNLPEKYSVDDNYINLVNNSRILFKNHLVIPGQTLQVRRNPVNEKGLIEFLTSKSFNLERILKIVSRIKETDRPFKSSLKLLFKQQQQ